MILGRLIAIGAMAWVPAFRDAYGWLISGSVR